MDAIVITRTDGHLTLPAALVKEMLGGKFPDSGMARNYQSGFAWETCEYHVEEGRLVPYDGGSPAPGPDLCLRLAE